MENDKHIIDLISKMPTVQTPDDFTPRVMEAVRQTRKGVFGSMWHFLSTPRRLELETTHSYPAGKGSMDLVWHFLIAGFMYAIIGTFLLIGFSGIKYMTTLSEWISLQPYLWLASALSFLACGIVLHRGLNRGMTLVRFYVAFHIVLTVINGILISLSSALPLTILYTVLFATPIMLVGSSLFINNQKISKLFRQGEIFNHAMHQKS